VKRSGKLTQGVLLVHNNRPVHKSRLSKPGVAECGFVRIDIPSPNLAPCDNLLFPNLKKTLKATKFRDDDELRAAVERHFVDKPNEYFYNNNKAEYSLRESVSAQGREGRGFDSDPGRNLNNLKKKGHILSRDSEVTLSHWSRSIELVIMPLIDL
jgi:hypothetical protein